MTNTTDGEHKERLRADKRRLQNPYAHVEELHEDDDFMERVHATRRILENPHALQEYLFDESGEAIDCSAQPSPLANDQRRTTSDATRRTVSKREFQQRARQILRGYTPDTRRRRLPDHHRQFITRNESRPSLERAALLAELEKYDLSNTPGVTTYFNRERETFTEAKLRQIEQILTSNGSANSEMS